MLDLEQDWSLSFAGCGFMGIYYVGVISCILERFPRLVRGAFRIYGASAGALMAAVLCTDQVCADLMLMAREARRHRLGPLHPSFDLLRLVKHALLGPSDGRNVLVSDFHSREELIEALICSCFVPFYCGLIPPTYRGVHYVDGAVSDNLPRCQQKNTITISAYAGESDLCPRGSVLSFHRVRFNNVSIQVNSENMYRVMSTFFPPEPQAMAEICQNGYADALRFLQENRESWCSREGTCLLQRTSLLCEACRDAHAAAGLLSHVTHLPKKVSSYLQLPTLLPVESAYSLAQRLVHWIPDVHWDVRRLYGAAGDAYRQAWSGGEGHRDTDVHYGNMSIQVNTGNLHRICSSFLPPRLEVPAHPASFYFTMCSSVCFL
uniref:PNPLA domain-containing protein n=1 Tax=Mola mola TaxID=94237 RepID=A0A3Q3X7E8_MOLML